MFNFSTLKKFKSIMPHEGFKSFLTAVRVSADDYRKFVDALESSGNAHKPDAQKSVRDLHNSLAADLAFNFLYQMGRDDDVPDDYTWDDMSDLLLKDYNLTLSDFRMALGEYLLLLDLESTYDDDNDCFVVYVDSVTYFIASQSGTPILNVPFDDAIKDLLNKHNISLDDGTHFIQDGGTYHHRVVYLLRRVL